MPSHDDEQQLIRDFLRLNSRKRALFLASVAEMVEDLRAKKPVRASPRMRSVQGHPGVFEMTWDMPKGRATFSYGTERTPGDPHIHRRRIGGHDIFGNP